MGFVEKTDYLLETKSMFKDRLNSLGAEITEQTTFRNYLVWLNNLYNKLQGMTVSGLGSLKGNTTQTTTQTGKNKFQYNTNKIYTTTQNGSYLLNSGNNTTYIDISLQDNGYYINSYNNSGYRWYSVIVNLEKNKSYKLLYGQNNLIGTDPFKIYGYNSLEVGARGTLISNLVSGGTFNTGDYEYYLLCFYPYQQGRYVKDIQIVESSITDTSYEPYIPNSPSPDYPQPINITTGRQVVSVSDGTTTNEYEINLGKNLYNPSFRNSNNSIRVNAGTATESNGTYTLVASGSDLFIWNVLTSTNTDYNSDCGPLISFDSNTFSVSISNSSFTKNFITFYDDNKKSIGYKFIQQSTFTFTKGESSVPSNAKYFSLRIGNGSATSGTTYTFTIQVEKGQPTSYTPYKTPIYLGKIGTYQDYIFRNTTENPLYDSNLEEGQWYIHKEIGRVVVDGTESGWMLRSNTSPNYIKFRNDNIFPEYIKDRLSLISNYFVANGGANDAGYSGNAICGNSNQYAKWLHVSIDNTIVSDVATFQTWLGTHNLEIYYVLNTPTNTLIEDEELINQLNEIEIYEYLKGGFGNEID